MRFYFSSTIFLLSVFFGFTHAQTIDSAGYDPSASISARSSESPAPGSIIADTAKSPPADQNQPQKLTLIKRKYNSRQQVLLATGMMIFVIGIMTMAQQWNPQ
jgi:hypothetical protein